MTQDEHIILVLALHKAEKAYKALQDKRNDEATAALKVFEKQAEEAAKPFKALAQKAYSDVYNSYSQEINYLNAVREEAERAMGKIPFHCSHKYADGSNALTTLKDVIECQICDFAQCWY